jgi:hypothetical protein
VTRPNGSRSKKPEQEPSSWRIERAVTSSDFSARDRVEVQFKE